MPPCKKESKLNKFISFSLFKNRVQRRSTIGTENTSIRAAYQKSAIILQAQGYSTETLFPITIVTITK